ncbi:MAG: Rpn family recombination-promoting nuclease/putative transposase [Klebsiella oxytoca]|nr:Rpn family recombination-promoting nuclease/putative transposase [Klebsiella oxytoca]
MPRVIPLLFYHGRISPYPHSTRWLDGFSLPEVAERLYSQNFPLIDVTEIPDDQLMHIRQRHMMDISEQLVRISPRDTLPVGSLKRC